MNFDDLPDFEEQGKALSFDDLPDAEPAPAPAAAPAPAPVAAAAPAPEPKQAQPVDAPEKPVTVVDAFRKSPMIPNTVRNFLQAVTAGHADDFVAWAEKQRGGDPEAVRKEYAEAADDPAAKFAGNMAAAAAPTPFGKLKGLKNVAAMGAGAAAYDALSQHGEADGKDYEQDWGRTATVAGTAMAVTGALEGLGAAKRYWDERKARNASAAGQGLTTAQSAVGAATGAPRRDLQNLRVKNMAADTYQFALDNKLIDAADNAAQIENKVTHFLRTDPGPKIQNTLAQLDAKLNGRAVSTQHVINELRNEAARIYRDSPMERSVADELVRIADDWAKTGKKTMTLSELVQQKGIIDDELARLYQNPDAKVSTKPLFMSRSIVNQTVDQAANAIDPALAAQLKEQGKRYHLASNLAHLSRKGSVEDLGLAGDFDYSIGSGAFAMAMGASPASSITAGALRGVVNNTIRERAASTIAVGADALGKSKVGQVVNRASAALNPTARRIKRILSIKPQTYGKFTTLLLVASQQGREQEVHEQLMTSDPEYRALDRKSRQEFGEDGEPR